VKADVVVVGGGPNGLTTAALLAKGGLKTVLVERRETLGGAAVTEEFHPGYSASSVAQTAGPFRASLVAELGLAGNGLAFVEPEPRLFAPLPDGRALRLYGDPARSASSIAAFSAKDAARWPEFHAAMQRTAGVLARTLTMTPPDIDDPGVRDVFPLLGLGWDLRGLGRKDGQNLLRWGPMAVADFAQEWFETPLLQAVIAARGIHGAFAGPWSAGTTAHLLLQAAATGGNGAGSSVLVKGGLGSLTRSLADAARRFGAELRTSAPAARVLVKDGRVAGLALESGEEIEAKAVASSADLHRTCLGLLDPASLDPDDLRRVRNFRLQGMASRVNLALSALPTFPAAGDDLQALQGRIHVGSEIDAIERAFDEAKYGGISRHPYLDVTIPSLTDPDLAPAGKQVLSAYVQYTPYRLKTGDWKTRKDEVLEVVLDALETCAPGLKRLVVGSQVLTPLDLEETYGITGGHPGHGEPSLDQLFLSRPLLGWGRYRAPLPGLFLCGAGTHPGGGVTGLPGSNAAREILRDLK
jgi:phytoene dehydrogenase-like protein